MNVVAFPSTFMLCSPFLQTRQFNRLDFSEKAYLFYKPPLGRFAASHPLPFGTNSTVNVDVSKRLLKHQGKLHKWIWWEWLIVAALSAADKIFSILLDDSTNVRETLEREPDHGFHFLMLYWRRHFVFVSESVHANFRGHSAIAASRAASVDENQSRCS
jgi:hypothetical protein